MEVGPKAGNKAQSLKIIIGIFKEGTQGIVFPVQDLVVYPFVKMIIGKAKAGFKFVLGTSYNTIKNGVGIIGGVLYVIKVISIIGILVMIAKSGLISKALIGQLGENVA